MAVYREYTAPEHALDQILVWSKIIINKLNYKIRIENIIFRITIEKRLHNKGMDRRKVLDKPSKFLDAGLRAERVPK